MALNQETANESNEIVYKLLEEVFESCICEVDFTDGICSLMQLYDSFSSQGFEQSFERILMFTVSEPKRSTDVQKIFKFISEFSVAVDTRYKNEQKKDKMSKIDDEEDDDIHPFLKQLFGTLENWSKTSSCVVRYRSCQLLYMMLTRILDNGDGEIDVNTYEEISALIQNRRRDVSANVRANSVLLAKFFQDPMNHNDPVIAGLCWQMQTDPNPRVRQNIVDIIAACEETIIPITKRFLSDKNSLVRNAALLHICHRISPRSYTTQYRILILNKCFQDSAAIVRRNAEQKLIPVWFRAYGDKLCVFFKNLRLGNDCLDKLPFAKTLIHLLFKLVKISQVLQEIDFNPETALPKSLNAEKIFVWRNFLQTACRQEKLKNFVPQTEDLIEFIIKSFNESEFDEACAYNELISLTMDVIDILGEEKCEKLPPLALDVMRNPYVPRSVIPYAVAFYCEYAVKETKEIHNDLLQIINILMKFVELSTGEEQKRLILICLDIFSETLAQENISASIELMTIKDELVLVNLDSDDLEIKEGAFRALSLYCLLDLEEARQFWPLIEKTLFESPYSLKLSIIKGALDIFKCYGCKVFGDQSEETMNEFEEILEKLFDYAKKQDFEMKIVLIGMFKLYLSHHTYAPLLMAKLIMTMFDPDVGFSVKNDIVNFLELYGESSLEAECLTKSFLTIINLLFRADRNDPYHRVNVKTVVLQLLEFAKLYEENKNFDVEEKFSELLLVKLTKKFLKRSYRMPLLDLHDICLQNMPKDIDALLKLKANIKLILESLDSTNFQQKNPFSKKSVKFFTIYLKKIQTALDTAPDEIVNHSQRFRSSPEDFLSTVITEQVSPPEQKEKSFED